MARFVLSAVAAAVAVVGCGGGSGTALTESNTNPQTLVTGTTAVAAGSVVAYDSSGQVLSTGTVGADGVFVLPLNKSALAQNLLISAESSGKTIGVGLSHFAPANTLSAKTSLHLSALSTVAALLQSQHQFSAAEAQQYSQLWFGIHSDGLTQPASRVSAQQLDASQLALHNQAFAQLTQLVFAENAIEHSAALAQAITQDLADKTIDGQQQAQIIELNGKPLQQWLTQSAYVQAYTKAQRASALLSTELGKLPVVWHARSTNYQVSVTSDSNKHGAQHWQLRLRDSNNQAVVGQKPLLMPMMYMAGHHHATPKGACSVSDAQGISQCSLYFLMPATTANGSSQGYWQVEAKVAGENLTLFPQVDALTGQTARVVFKGIDDRIDKAAMEDHSQHMAAKMAMDDATDETRSYYVFVDAASRAQVTFFVAAKNTMLDFPALDVAGELVGVAGQVMKVTQVQLQVSTDQGLSWKIAQPQGQGRYSVANLTLPAGENALQLRLMVNGEQKTTDGQLSDGVNDVQVINLKL